MIELAWIGIVGYRVPRGWDVVIFNGVRYRRKRAREAHQIDKWIRVTEDNQ